MKESRYGSYLLELLSLIIAISSAVFWIHEAIYNSGEYTYVTEPHEISPYVIGFYLIVVLSVLSLIVYLKELQDYPSHRSRISELLLLIYLLIYAFILLSFALQRNDGWQMYFDLFPGTCLFTYFALFVLLAASISVMRQVGKALSLKNLLYPNVSEEKARENSIAAAMLMSVVFIMLILFFMLPERKFDIYLIFDFLAMGVLYTAIFYFLMYSHMKGGFFDATLLLSSVLAVTAFFSRGNFEYLRLNYILLPLPFALGGLFVLLRKINERGKRK